MTTHGAQAGTRHAPPPADAVAAALALHRAGRLAEAEHAYRAALATAPDHPGALTGLGVLHHQRGDSAAALPLLARAARISPGAEASFNLGLALLRLGQARDAARRFRESARARPDWPEAHYNLALARIALGEADAARASLRTALRLRPGYFQAAVNLGNLLLATGEPAEAARLFRDAIAEAPPDDPQPWNGLGAALLATHDPAGAEAAFAAALARAPDFAEALGNLGTLVLRWSGRRAQGEALLRRCLAALEARGADPAAALTRAEACRGLRDHAGAEAILAGVPEPHRTWRHALMLAEVRREQGKLEAAEAALPRRVPDGARAEALTVRGVLLRDRFRLAEAEAALRMAARLDARHAGARGNLGYTLLTAGQMVEGLALLEARHELSRRAFPQGTAWDGGAAARVLVLPEEGFGDMLQFARFLPVLAETGAAVRFAAPPALARLLGSLGPAVTIAAPDAVPDPAERWAMLMSLPRLLGVPAPDAPAGPYLAADPPAVAAWRGQLGDGFTAGLVWNGNPEHEADHLRSIDPALLAPLGAVPGVTWISLQKHRSLPPPPFKLRDCGPALADFADTAALVAALDIVITVDSAVAHLAGALGRPVWLLNRFSSDWRWQCGDRPVWYASLREFRQPAPNDWATPIAAAASALAALRDA